MIISFDDFLKIDIRVGEIIEIEDFPEARKPAYKLTIDFGPEIGQKRSSAQITTNYTKEELLGRKIAAVINFEPKRIAGSKSEVLVLGFEDEAGAVSLAGVSGNVPKGRRLH